MKIIVDDCDLPLLTMFKWKIYTHKGASYAIASIDGILVRLHRLIMGAESGQVVDHINHNGLDNRRGNLRVCSHAENCRNRRLTSGKRFKGVFAHNRNGKNPWRAKITVNYREIRLGDFRTEEDAARAYDAAAILYHGQFALTNRKLGLL